MGRKRTARAPVQMALGLSASRRGGARPGAGRKPTGRYGKKDGAARAGVRHQERPQLASRHPVHVTMRVARGLPSLRTQRVLRMVEAVAQAPRVEGFCVVHFSIQKDHVHMIVEAADAPTLSCGMRSFAIRFALRLNRLMSR